MKRRIGALLCFSLLGCDGTQPPLNVDTSPAVLRARAAEISRLDARAPAALVEHLTAQQGTFGAADRELSVAVARKLAECKLDCEPAIAALLSSDSTDDRWIAFRAAMNMSSRDRAKIEHLMRAAPRESISEDEAAIRARVLDAAR